jgi:hypothetical protein
MVHMLRFIFIFACHQLGFCTTAIKRRLTHWDAGKKLGGTYYHDITIKPDYKTKL